VTCSQLAYDNSGCPIVTSTNPCAQLSTSGNGKFCVRHCSIKRQHFESSPGPNSRSWLSSRGILTLPVFRQLFKKMAAPRNRPYRHRGVYIPFVAADEGNQWSSDDNIQKKGFIFIDRLHVKGNVLSVQSAATGDIFINKLLEAGKTHSLVYYENYMLAR
jgi:hypothetical protein